MTGSFRQWWLPVFSGVFIGTSYIPFPPWASLFCFVPLWLFWSRQTHLRVVLAGGFLTAFVFTLIGFNWVTYLLHEFAHLDWPIAVLGMGLFALLAHLFVPLAGGLWFLGQRRWRWNKNLSLGLMALITTLCEAYTPTLFDWNFGYSWFGANVPLYHWAEIIGFSGLSAATLLCNLPLLYAWQSRHERRARRFLGLVLAGFLAANLAGLWLWQRLPEPDASLRVVLVQGNIGNAEKMAAELGKGYQQGILETFLSLTDAAVAELKQPVDFVLWPETAFPALMGEGLRDTPYTERLRSFLRDRRLALVTGAYGIDPDSRLVTNSLFVLNREGAIVPPHYSKTILLAFGEYIPGEEWLPQIRDWLPPTGQFARGPGPTVLLEWNGYRMGPQICYESLFPAFSRSLADLGAQFIVNTTNDSWYGNWQEPWQHLFMTLARGVELRRPVLRVTNTGISTVGLANGKVLEQSPLHQPWVGVYDVPYLVKPPATFYQRAYWLVPAMLWTILSWLLWRGLSDRSR
ncbi:MAG: apolipoprotein N-acyltransferase [Methylococcus sp.]